MGFGAAPPDGEPPATAPSANRVPGELRLAAGILAAQALGLLAIGVFLLAKTAGGSAAEFGRAASDTGFALGAAVLLVFAARALLRMQPAVRTPVVVVELLALPIGYSLGVQAHRIWYGGPVLLSALAVLYLLFTPAARRVLER